MRISHLSKSTCVVYFILGGVLLYGCTFADGTARPTATSHISVALTMTTTQSVIPIVPTITPSPTTTTVIPHTADSLLLIGVNEYYGPSGSNITTDQVRSEIWLMEPNNTTPVSFLHNDRYSFDVPTWSHDGKWIAYLQRDMKERQALLGIISKDGTDQKLVMNETVGYVYPSWSWDDRMLTFVGYGAQGRIAYSLELATGNLRVLNPNPTTNYSMIWLSPSPQENIAFFAGLDLSNTNQPLEMWLVPLDGQGENIQLPPKAWSRCNGLISVDWSPDGKSLIIEDGIVKTDIAPSSKQVVLPPELCKPAEIWQYTFVDNSWSKTAEPPVDNPIFENMRNLNWSPDGRWVSWDDNSHIIIYDAHSWNIVREIELKNLRPLQEIWMTDSTGNSLLALREITTYTQGLWTYSLYGTSPNGTNKDDVLLAQILQNPEWLPISDNIIDYVPLSWQP